MPAKNGKNNAKNYSAPTTKSVNRTRSRAGPEMGAEVASNGLGSRDAFLQAFYSPERFAKCSEIRKPTNQRAFLHTTKRAKQELSLPLEWCEWAGFCLFLAQLASPFLRKIRKAVVGWGQSACSGDLEAIKRIASLAPDTWFSDGG